VSLPILGLLVSVDYGLGAQDAVRARVEPDGEAPLRGLRPALFAPGDCLGTQINLLVPGARGSPYLPLAFVPVSAKDSSFPLWPVRTGANRDSIQVDGSCRPPLRPVGARHTGGRGGLLGLLVMGGDMHASV
jgi:hypothetical protein